MEARKALTSIVDLVGPRRRVSTSSSSATEFRLCKYRDVLRPSSSPSGSSVLARLILSSKDDLLPDASSGSSVPARRSRDRSRDDFRPELFDSSGVADAAAYRGLGRAELASMLCLRCSSVVMARGLPFGFVMGSAKMLDRRFAVPLADVGLIRSWFSCVVDVA